MKRYFIYIIILSIGILSLSSCKDDKPKPIPYIEPETYQNVAILYYMADNDLSSNGFTNADLQEFKDGKNNVPKDSKVVIYVDRPGTTPIIYQLDACYGLRVWKELQKQDSTDSLTMLTNLRDIMAAFPATKYGLSFGAHGSGWVINKRHAIGYDQSHRNNWMNIPTLRGVLEQLPHFNYIFFDVCFMQSIEVAYELRNVTDWIVGSPAEIPGPGAPYHIICEAMCKGNAQGVFSGYETYYPTTYKGHYYPGVILSAIKCSELESLATATKTALSAIYTGGHMPSVSTEVQKYSTEYSSFTFCYDINSLMYHVLPPDEYNQWSDALEHAIPFRSINSGKWEAGHCSNNTIYDPTHFGGASMFYPENNYYSHTTNLRQFQWYKAAGWDNYESLFLN